MLATDMTTSGTADEKARWTFKMFDSDASGTIEMSEIIYILEISMMQQDSARSPWMLEPRSSSRRWILTRTELLERTSLSRLVLKTKRFLEF